MRKSRLVALATASLVGAAVLPLTAGTSGAAPAPATAPGVTPSDISTDYGHTPPAPKWKQRYDEIAREALEQRVRTGSDQEVQKLGKGVYGRAGTTGTEKVFVILTEFGKTRHPAFLDGETDAQTYDGPMHNAIPKPNRKKDNSTIWHENYSQKYFDNMYFNRMKKFYERESHGKYSIDGDVTEWVKVPFNQARYGRDVCGDIVCNNTWFLIRDGLAYWVEGKKEDGWSMSKITRYLKSFDELDRYDFDADGDFNESDGYIDHMQIVHAGGDQADGDPIYGEDAIWSHRWNAQIQPFGTGPEGGAPIGGVEIGEGGASGDPDGADGPEPPVVTVPDNPTGVWVNDYTIQPENGGLSVFAHEFGHDLGLPDHYDTSGNTGGAENSVGFWSLMSQSRGTLPADAGIGDRPMPFGAWDKLTLGWLDFDLARTGFSSTHKLRPAQSSDSSSVDDGLVVILPDKKVTSDLGAPAEDGGSKYFYSGSGNDLNVTMTHAAAGTALTASVNYEIEEEWDYAFLEASSDGGATWTPVLNNLSDTGEGEAEDVHNQSGFNESGTGITGASDGWVDLTATLPAGTNQVRFRYQTDSAAVESGFRADNIAIDGTTIGTAETDDEGWQLDGFRVTTGEETNTFLNAYLVENRQYVGGDKTLTHLYNFAGYEDRPNWVDFFMNTNGALINYWDSSQTDNNVGDHPGSGLILPIDAHPTFDVGPDGTLLRPRIAARDSVFGLNRTKKAVLHQGGVKYTLPSLKGKRVFNDLKTWWQADATGEGEDGYDAGWYGVDVPKTGTRIRVVRVNKAGVMTVRVASAG